MCNIRRFYDFIEHIIIKLYVNFSLRIMDMFLMITTYAELKKKLNQFFAVRFTKIIFIIHELFVIIPWECLFFLFNLFVLCLLVINAHLKLWTKNDNVEHTKTQEQIDTQQVINSVSIYLNSNT